MNKTVKWLFQLLKPYRWQVILGSLLVALTVLGNTGLLATSGLLLSKAALTPEVLLLMPLITGVRFFGIGRAVMRYAERLLNHSIAFKILGHLREDFYRTLEPLVPDDFPHYSQGKLYNQFIGDINVLQFFYLKAVSVPLGSLIIYTVCALFLAFYDARLIPMLLVGQLIAGIIVPSWAVHHGREKKHTLSEVQTALSEQFLEYKQGLADLHLFSTLESVQHEVNDKLHAMTRLHMEMSLKKKMVSRVVFAVSHLSMLLALFMLIPSVQSGKIGGVDVAMLALLVLASFEAIMQMPEAVLQMDESLAAAKDIHEVYEKTPRHCDSAEKTPEGFAIRAEDVAFSYHQQGRAFIEHLDLDIPEGAHVAFVGESGSGKSSIAHLLSGLWQVDGGRLTLGGVPMDAIAPATLHQMVATVEQESYFFYTSIRENMQLANENVSDEDIWRALAMVELDDVVHAIPEGLDAVLAENAAMLSGGQRQRLAIARMIVQNPKVAILDEALQKLDKDLAERVFGRLLEWGRGRTMVVVSHNLAMLDALDFSYVISYGRIIEKGPHNSLIMQHNGHYRALYDIERSQF